MNVERIVLTSWDQIRAYVRPSWVYRGQRSADWELATSLERCVRREDISPEHVNSFERELLRDFQRVYHQYATHVPASTAIMEWIALMQHHGAPTRLLDFSYSIYVAAYFAIEAADSDCAVWAVNAPWALEQSVAALVAAGQTSAVQFQSPTVDAHERTAAETVFTESCVPLALPLTPYRLNERLRAQRGTFLVPGSVSIPFMQNLQALHGHDDATSVVQLVLPRALRVDALRDLHAMNVSRTSLFPGLDGYSQSLGVFHPSFRPEPWN